MWFQLFSHAKIQSCVKLQVSWAAKMSGLLPALCLHGPTPCLSWFRFHCLALAPWRRGQCSSIIFNTAHKDSCNCSPCSALWGIISDHRENGRDNWRQIVQERTVSFPPTGCAVCCTMCSPASQDTGMEFFLSHNDCISREHYPGTWVKGFSVPSTECFFIPSLDMFWWVWGRGGECAQYVCLAVIWGKSCS